MMIRITDAYKQECIFVNIFDTHQQASITIAWLTVYTYAKNMKTYEKIMNMLLMIKKKLIQCVYTEIGELSQCQLRFGTMHNAQHIDGLVQDCSNFVANALALLQSCTKPSICGI